MPGSICVPNSCVSHLYLASLLLCDSTKNGSSVLQKKKERKKKQTLFLHRDLQAGASFKLEMVINIITGSREGSLIETAGTESDKLQIACYLIRRASV